MNGTIRKTTQNILLKLRPAGAKIPVMTTKDLVIESVKNMPDDAVIEDAMERLLIIAKIERGTEQADAGQTIPHEEVKQRLSKWLN